MLFGDEETASICLVDSLETALEVVKTYELETRSSFSVRSSKLKSFGHTVYDPLKRHRIYWEEKGGNGLPFSQVPFIVVNCMFLDCARGPDRHKNVKKKRDTAVADIQNLAPASVKKRFRISKKEDCPAVIQMKEIVFFPEYSISENTRSRKERMSKTLRDWLKRNENVIQERKIIVHLPAPSKHTNHTICQKPTKRQKIDMKLRKKITELVKNFITDPVEIQDRLLEYVNNVLLPKCPPGDRRFYPGDEDILIQVNAVLKKHKMRTADQEKFTKVIEEHAYANSENRLFLPINTMDEKPCLEFNEGEVHLAVNEILPLHSDIEIISECVEEEVFVEYSSHPVEHSGVVDNPPIELEADVQTITNLGVAEILKAAESLKKKMTFQRIFQVKQAVDNAADSSRPRKRQKSTESKS